MRITIGFFCMAASVALLLNGCVDHGSGAVGPGPGPVALVDCDGFYDDFYGPFDDGCWADDGVFWYRLRDGHYHRDDDGHFRHEAAPGMHPIHGVGPGAGRPLQRR